MLRKVRIIPKAQSGLEVKMRAGLGFNANQLSWPVMAGEFSEPDMEERQTLGPVDRNEANLEAEVGETAVTNLNGDGIPEHYKIGGKRHYDGGTPLNLPDNSYIFSRDNSMKIKDEYILEQFGITNAPRGGVTPADIAKKFNINKYKKILLDKDADDLAKKTAEMMISNCMIKLGKLAIIQESIKGFPEGIPFIAMPYLESVGLQPEDILPNKQQTQELVQAQPEQSDQDMAKYGAELTKYQGNQPNVSSNTSVGIGPANKITVKRKADGNIIYVVVNNAGNVIKEYNPGEIPPPYNKPAEEVYQQYKQQQTSTQQGQSSGTSQQQPTTPAARRNTTAQQTAGFFGGRAIPPLSSTSGTISGNDPLLSDKSNGYLNKFKDALADEDVKNSLYENYRNQLANELAEIHQKNVDGKISDKEYQALLEKYDPMSALTREEVVERFIDYQRQNYAMLDADQAFINKHGISMFDKRLGERGRSVFDVGKYNNNGELTKFVLGKRGWKNDDLMLDPISVGANQIANKAFGKLLASDQYKEKFKDFKLQKSSLGTYEDPGNVINPLTGQKTFSDTDFFPGGDDYLNTRYIFQPDPVKEESIPENAEVEVAEDITKTEIGIPQVRSAAAPWWLQDIIKTGSAFNELTKIKKYMPWQATPAVDYIDPAFFSPERELAANAEQLAIGAQGAAQFTGPQAFNARFSQMAGKAAANAADILGRYNNLNVGVANETEKFNVQTFNQYARQKASDATELFDKTTIANQQYDASKAKARQEFVNAYTTGITNRAEAQALNTMFPDWQVDPMSGGLVKKIDSGRTISPTIPTDYLEEFNKLTFPPGWSTKEKQDFFWRTKDPYGQYRKSGKSQNPYDPYDDYDPADSDSYYNAYQNALPRKTPPGNSYG